MSGHLVVQNVPAQMDLQLPPPRLRVGDKIALDGILYEAGGRSHGQQVLVQMKTRAETRVDNCVMAAHFNSGNARLCLPDWMPKARHGKWNTDFASLHVQDKKLATMRHAYVLAFCDNARRGYPHKVGALLQEVYLSRLSDPLNVGERRPSLSAIYV